MSEIVEQVARAIMKEAGMINNPKIKDDVSEHYLISLMYARRYARAAIGAMLVAQLVPNPECEPGPELAENRPDCPDVSGE